MSFFPTFKILTRSAPRLGLESEIAWPPPSLLETSRAPTGCQANSLLRRRNAGRARRPPFRRRMNAEWPPDRRAGAPLAIGCPRSRVRARRAEVLGDPVEAAAGAG